MLPTNLSDIKSLSYGMDIIIISVTSIHEEIFWKKRLDQMRGQIVKSNALIITVFEDWDKGAGNALGTFYAFKKAREYAATKYQIDLIECLASNSSIAIYHTAGKGTRLAPMTGCEYNSKSRIKLVGPLFKKSHSVPITLLEAVIKQTSLLAPYRKGRLSVFWGDQIFIPSEALKETCHEIDLLIKPIENKPTEKEWIENGFDKYGFVIVNDKGEMKQLEKLSYLQFSELKLKKDEQLAFSLGSFSLSKSILEAFLNEFSHELKNKTGSFDSDPHLWMPLSLDELLYLNIMEKKENDLELIKKHWARIQNFKTSFLKTFSSPILIGASSMGAQTYWWDYGNRKSYFENILKLIDHSDEGEALRNFFSIPIKPENHFESSKLKIENSILINCSIHSGEIKNSVLINVTANEINSNRSLIINTSSQKIDVKEAILYNSLENGQICLDSNQIRADNFSNENGHIKLYHSIYSNLPWDQTVKGNSLSFEQLHQFNQETNPVQGQKLASALHNKIKQAVFDLQK